MAKPFTVEGLLLEKVIRRVGMPLTPLQTLRLRSLRVESHNGPLSDESCRGSEALIAMLPWTLP